MMDGGPGRDKQSKVFDLLSNPFSLLRIEVSANLQKVTDAVDDALTDKLAPEADLIGMREVIINPRLRTFSEISFLLDTPVREANAILDALRSKAAFNDTIRAADRLAPLSKANLLAHIAAHYPASADLLFSLVDAQAQIEPEKVHLKIESVRRSAGMVIPTLETVRDQLHELMSLHAKAAFASFPTPKASVASIEECTRRVLASADVDRIDALDGILKAFSQTVAPELSRLEEGFRTSSKILLQKSDDSAAISSISIQLRDWTNLARPLLVFDAHKERDEERARQFFNEVRSLAIDLANEHDRFDTALSISKLCVQYFQLLPRAVDQLKEDLLVLERRSSESSVVPLKNLIDEIRSSGLSELVSDLIKYGFASSAPRQVKMLWTAFSEAVHSVKESAAADLPWLMLRSFAIEINNEENEPLAAKFILEGLLQFSNGVAASDEVVKTIQNDLSLAHRNILDKKLLEEVKANRISSALETLEQLLRSPVSDEDRANLVSLRSQLKSKQSSRYVKWGVYGVIASVVLFGIMSDKSPPQTTYRPPPPLPPSESRRPTPTPAPLQIPLPTTPIPKQLEDYTELRPAVGRGVELTRNNIRYCLYQKERFKTIKSDLKGNTEIDAFNLLVNDYNSRCGNFRYLESDMSAISGEVIAKSATLAAEGRSILLTWRRASSLTSEQPNAFPLPKQTLPPVLPPREEARAADALDLIQLENSTNVQRRLNELSYFKGPINGAWGPQSRMALRAFKTYSGLSSDDRYDFATAEALFSATATRAQASLQPKTGGTPTIESIYPPPTGATLNPLNGTDASKIHVKLRELGFYRSTNNTLWSGASRDALKEFKQANSLSFDDRWDAATENRLLNAPPNDPPKDIRSAFESVVGGVWSSDVRACPGGIGNSDVLALKISSRRAETDGAHCEFAGVSGQGQNWKTSARCLANGETWVANVSLVRLGDTLTWSSERGTANYFRCQ